MSENPQQDQDNQNQNQQTQNPNAILNQIKKLGETSVAGAKTNIHAMTIIGQIEGHQSLPPKNKTTKYEHIIPQLLAVEQNDNIEGLVVVLNTVGGDVEAGLAIAEMISTVSKPTVTLVTGGGHSIGVPIAVSSDYSYIAESSTMLIHPVRLTGMVIGVEQSFEYIEKIQERVNRFVISHSDITEEKLEEFMYNRGALTKDVGSNILGKEAVESGLVNEIGGVSQALAKAQELIDIRKGNQAQAQPQPQQGQNQVMQ